MDSTRIGIIADDFTGAMDTGAQMLACGETVRVWLSSTPPPLQSFVVLSTDSRELPAPVAAERVRAAITQLSGRRLYKKIDSTLRGHIGGEITAALQASGISKCVVCPAVIAGGRTVQDGRLLVNGLPLEMTALGQDPGWPARTSAIADILQFDCTHIPLALVRGPVEKLSLAICNAATPAVITDAVLDSDLERIGQAVSTLDVLPCGALGFARAWVRALMPDRASLALSTEEPARPLPTPLLVVCGSASPVAIQLSEALAQQPATTLIEVALPLDPHSTSETVKSAVIAIQNQQTAILRPRTERMAAYQAQIPEVLGGLTRQVIERARPGALLVIGGETARQVVYTLQASAIHIQQDLGPGLAAGEIEHGVCSGLPVVTMSGSLGGPAAFQLLLGRAPA